VTNGLRSTAWALVFVVAAGALANAQVSFERILRADQEPQNWLTYSGNLSGWRYSPLTQITPANVRNLELQWLFQTRAPAEANEKFEATPLVVDGVMYTVLPPNHLVALDAATGRMFWIYSAAISPLARVCCGRVNRGVAILGDTLFMATIDGHLIAIDAKNGRPIWDKALVDPALGYSFTLSPLIVKDKVIVGPSGGEYGIRGFVAAFDAKTGAEVWRFNTIPGPGEPGHDTWIDAEKTAWKTGGGPAWVTGSYDPQLNLTYWGTGNPGPDWNGDPRPGDNLYTDSVIALDADTGRLKWHYQFTPHDEFDYDATQVPVLVDIPWQGQPRKLMLWANRNGFWYVLDRTTGQFLQGKPYTKVTWATGFDEHGRPKRALAPTHEARSSTRTTRARRTGTRRRTARAPACSTFQAGWIRSRVTSKCPSSTRKAASSSAGFRRCRSRRCGRPRARSISGCPRTDTARSRRSTRGPASANGNSRWST
jgi:alcohol dehydrogenase (cytochrome c)